MALLFADGFDQYGTLTAEMLNGNWAEINANVSLRNASPAPPTGARYLWFSNSANTIARRIFGGPKVTAGVGGRFYFPNLPTSAARQILMQFRDNANVPQISLVANTTGSIQVKRGAHDGVTVGETADGILQGAAWQHFECKTVFSQSAGSVVLRRNETDTVLTLSGIDTCATSNVEASQVIFGQPTSFASGAAMGLEDVYGWDDDASDPTNQIVDWLGDKKVYLLMVAGDTAYADFLLSSGSSGYALIDEVPADIADYIETLLADKRSDFSVQALPSEAVKIAAVIPFVKAYKTDAGAADLQVSATTGAAIAGPVFSLTTQPTYYGKPSTIEPVSGGLWTPARVAALHHSMKRTA